MNQRWLDSFQNAKLTNLEVTTSDHCLILLEPVIETAVVQKRRFRFENAWLREPMCKKIVEETWEKVQNGATFHDKISSCTEVLSSWGQEVTGNFRRKINQSKKILRVFKGRRDVDSIKQYQEENKRLTEILTQQEVFWKQSSKQLWLKE